MLGQSTMGDILDSQKYVSSTCLSLLLLEVVPTSIRVSHKLKETSNAMANIDEQTRFDTKLSSIPDDLPGTVNVLENPLINNDDVTIRVENYGYNLGLRLSEVLMYKISNPNISQNSSTKIVDVLDIMKFVCRDVWKNLYGKQMDNLRTNHRGTFVLVDNNYKLINNLNGSKTESDTLIKSSSYIWFPCGIIRGILMSFGIDANVTAEITAFPAVTFNIQTAINN